MRSRGETAIQQSWEEIIQFFAARGCAGTAEEIKRVVLNRIQGAKILGQAAKVLPKTFRPQMHNLSAPPSGLATAVSGLRRGRERREVNALLLVQERVEQGLHVRRERVRLVEGLLFCSLCQHRRDVYEYTIG